MNPQYYHKSKLVVLAESNPFKNGPFKFMDKLVSGMAGGIGDFGTQPERTVFETKGGVKLGTAICYESVFPDFYREWANNGANVMSIITNDGWWGNTPGYRQHLSYASLRAIETRRSIARSANTGISALINQRGEIISSTEWWKPAYINGELKLNNKLTVFVKHGDIIGRVCKFLFFLFMLMAISRRCRKSSCANGTL
jgi:apolipoprotein N-acyltransferase